MVWGSRPQAMHRGAAAGLLAISFLVIGTDADPNDGEDGEDFVLELTKEDFEQKLQKHHRVLVKFYTPWSGHCKTFAPEYSKASKLMKIGKLDTMLAKVDADEAKDLVSKFDITSYPTLIYFVNGKKSKDYDGKRDAEGIFSWLKTKEASVVRIMAEGEVRAWLDATQSGTFALLARVKDGHSRKTIFFTAVEETLAEWDQASLKFGVVLLPPSADPKTDSSLSMWRPGWPDPDPTLLKFSGVWSNNAVLKFAMNATYQSIGEKFNRSSYAPQSLNKMGWSAAVVVATDDATIGNEENDQKKEGIFKTKIRDVLLPVALGNPEWKFVFADINELDDQELELLGVAHGSEPRIIWLGVNRMRYQLVGRREIANRDLVRQFMSDVKAERLKPFYRSEAPPESELDENGIRIITGDNFEDIAKDPTKDVFVEFYTPSCQDCQKLASEWVKLAKKAKKAGWLKRNIVIAKFNAASNECEEEVEGLPKLVLYPAVKAAKKMKARHVYSGKKEAAALYEFVAEKAKNLEDIDEDEGGRRKKRKKSVETMVERELKKKRKAAEEL